MAELELRSLDHPVSEAGIKWYWHPGEISGYLSEGYLSENPPPPTLSGIREGVHQSLHPSLSRWGWGDHFIRESLPQRRADQSLYPRLLALLTRALALLTELLPY